MDFSAECEEIEKRFNEDIKKDNEELVQIKKEMDEIRERLEYLNPESDEAKKLKDIYLHLSVRHLDLMCMTPGRRLDIKNKEIDKIIKEFKTDVYYHLLSRNSKIDSGDVVHVLTDNIVKEYIKNKTSIQEVASQILPLILESPDYRRREYQRRLDSYKWQIEELLSEQRDPARDEYEHNIDIYYYMQYYFKEIEDSFKKEISPQDFINNLEHNFKKVEKYRRENTDPVYTDPDEEEF